jgi:hypothetical protein
VKKLKNSLAKLFSFLPDKLFCTITFLISHQRFPQLKNPKLFNDKLLKLKLTSREKKLSALVDKYEVRAYIKDKIGEQYLIPLIAVFDSVEQINFKELPPKFALKITNGSQHNLICTNKSTIDYNITKLEIEKWLTQDFYRRTREWPYKSIKSRIVIEELIEDNSGSLNDYKFWCFNGNPEFVQIDSNRFIKHCRDFYDIEFKNRIPLKITHPFNNKGHFKPKNYSTMVDIARTLAIGHKFLRVDLYNVNGQIFFGEMTLYPGNCNEKFSTIDYEKILGDLLSI